MRVNLWMISKVILSFTLVSIIWIHWYMQDPLQQGRSYAKDTHSAVKTASRIALLSHDTEPVNADAQKLVDYIASNVSVQVRPLNNLKAVWAYTGQLSLVNTGYRAVEYGPWSLYFHHFGVFEPKEIREFHEVKIGQNKDSFLVKHIDGDLYCMTPLPDLLPILPNQKMDLTFTASGSLASRYLAFPNWYVTAPGAQPRILSCTRGEDLAFAGPFDTPATWKTQPDDAYDPFTPDTRYSRNDEIKDRGRAVIPIIPTPYKMVHASVEAKAVQIDRSSWKVVCSGDLVNECRYLSEKLGIPLGDATIRDNIIHLEVGQIDAKNFPDYQQDSLGEAYSLEVDPDGTHIRLVGSSSHGVFNGIQTLLGATDSSTLTLPVVTVMDAPRFTYRGLMIDVARNFRTKAEILKVLDVMAAYKMNVFHFHLTDDQGWRLEIPGLEELTQVGSRRSHDFTKGLALEPFFGSGPFGNDTHTSGFYTTDDYRDILRYAKARHIRVLPEIDMPSHAHAAVVSMETRFRLLDALGERTEAERYRLKDPDDTSVYFAPNGYRQTCMNPCRASTYIFVEAVMAALINLHQDIAPLEVLHIGGDEVPEGVFSSSPMCEALDLAEDVAALREHFVRHVAAIAAKLKLKLQVWEDLILHDSGLAYDAEKLQLKGMAVNAWNNMWENGNAHRSATLANSGYKVILSMATHQYYDMPQEPDPEERGLPWASRHTDTRRTFQCDAVDVYNNLDVKLTGRPLGRAAGCAKGGPVTCVNITKPENVIGLQGQMWSELLRTAPQMEAMIFPRLLATAERAWHRASWEGVLDETSLGQQQTQDWELFANTLGYKELRRLEEMGVNYYLPPPGARISNGVLSVNSAFPGLAVVVSRDAGVTWSDVTQGMQVNAGELQLATSSFNRKRRSRLIKLTVA